ncbi:MAG: signal peptidase I [Candidatus Dojkabacteria bacterium]
MEPIKKQKKTNVFLDIMQSVAIALTLSVFLYLFILTPSEVDGPSMQPNFETGDLLYTSKLHHWFSDTPFGEMIGLDYNRGDVVVFQKPGLDDFVKRIIAIPGDTIRIEDGFFYVNGEKLIEEYEINNMDKRDGTFLRNGAPPITLGEDEFFLAGDNRDVSYDSRILGPIKREWIKGKVIFRFWPLQKFGIIGSGKTSLSQ